MPDNTLCRLSPSGSRVARMTSRAGIRTRTVVPDRDVAICREQRTSVKCELDETAVGMRLRDDGIEDAAESNAPPAATIGPGDS